MSRPKLSEEERKKYQKHIDSQKSLYERRRRLYNRKYRKSFIYISNWVVRLLYIALFFIVLTNNEKSSGFTNEIVLDKEIELFVVESDHETDTTTNVFIKTEKGSYKSTIAKLWLPQFSAGDTLRIERNIFGKAIYFTKNNWGEKYSIYVNFMLYFSVLFFTILTFFFNDGLDRFTDKILWLGWTLDILAITLYFVT